VKEGGAAVADAAKSAGHSVSDAAHAAKDKVTS